MHRETAQPPAEHRPAQAASATVQPALARAFAALDSRRVRWALLRGEAGLGTLDGELDLLVHPADAAAAAACLCTLGYARLGGTARGTHRFFLRYDRDGDAWSKLDVVTDLAFGGHQELPTAAAAACLSRRRSSPIASLAPDDAFWALLLHCLLDKGEVAERHRGPLARLVGEAATDGELAVAARAWCPEGWSPQRLVEAVAAADWTALEALAAAWPAALPARARARRALNRLRRRLARPLERRRWRTLRVALLAPDGAGKSTLIQRLAADWPLPVWSAYMGLYPADEARGGPPPLRLARRLARLWRGYLGGRRQRAGGRLVLFDRYPYDALLSPEARTGRKTRARRALLGRACPAPELVVALDAPGTVLHARSQEQSPEQLESQRRRYRLLAERLSRRRRPLVVMLDADQPLEQVRRDLVQALWAAWAARLNARG